MTKNTKNKSFAIPAEAAATPPNPNSAAISAIIRKVTAQPNIFSPPFNNESHQAIVMRAYFEWVTLDTIDGIISIVCRDLSFR